MGNTLREPNITAEDRTPLLLTRQGLRRINKRSIAPFFALSACALLLADLDAAGHVRMNRAEILVTAGTNERPAVFLPGEE